MNGAQYRHEYKYFISAGELAQLRLRAEAVLQRDPHIQSTGRYAGMYNIRSVYFDDPNNTAYWENENGTDPREKFRIRIYNHADSHIRLELKARRAGKCTKQGCPLTREQCERLLQGEGLPPSKGYPPILQKLLLARATRLLRPVVLVEYDRIPYVYAPGNVRVTLDCNVRSSPEVMGLFRESLPLRPVLPPGQHILEVKWDEFLPDFLYRSLMLEGLQWTSVSKFYLCRRFSLG